MGIIFKYFPFFFYMPILLINMEINLLRLVMDKIMDKLNNIPTSWTDFKEKEKSSLVEYLFVRYKDSVRSYIQWKAPWIKSCKDHDVDDLVQKVFYQFTKNDYKLLDDIKKSGEEKRKNKLDKSTLRDYFRLIIKRQLIDLWRKQKRWAKMESITFDTIEVLDEFFVEKLDIENALDDMEKEKPILHKIAIMRFIDGKKHEEIMEEMQLTKDIIRYRIEQAKQYLQKKLDR